MTECVLCEQGYTQESFAALAAAAGLGLERSVIQGGHPALDGWMLYLASPDRTT